MSTELKPCPFCGGTHLQTYSHGSTEEPDNYVQCAGCTTTGPFAWTPDEAIAAWNRRATQPAVTGEAGGDELPPLPAWALMDNLGNIVPSDVRKEMRDYGKACYAIGRGAAVREYIASGDAVKAAGQSGEDAANDPSKLNQKAMGEVLDNMFPRKP